MDTAAEFVVVPVERIPGSEDLPLPKPATDGASGMDLHACVAEEVVIPAGGRWLIPTGLRIAVPEGYEFQVRPRSGLAFRYGLTLLNSPGTIDADFRGEVQVLLVNLGEEPFTVRRGDRIAQLVLARVPRVCWQEVTMLPESRRGFGGFGHTGVGRLGPEADGNVPEDAG